MGRWRWSLGLAFALAVGCGESTRHVPGSPEGGGEAGAGRGGSQSAAGGGGDAGGTGGEGGVDDGHSQAGSSRGGTAGAGTGGVGGNAGAGEAGERGEPAGGKAGRDTGEDCPPSAAGQTGETGNLLWAGDPDPEAEGPWCVPDCSSADYVSAAAVGCDWVCPATAPVLAESCEIRCDPSVSCGPSLYCSRWTRALSNATESCAEDPDDEEDFRDCSCKKMPESCTASDADRPVCGEDGKRYPSFCEAHRARTDVVGFTEEARCVPAVDAYFNCGGLFCLRGSEYCVLQRALDDHDLDRFFCEPNPCGETGTCDCVIADIVANHGQPEEDLDCVEPEPGVFVVDDDRGSW